MANKLDQSLDEILNTQQRSARRARGGGRHTGPSGSTRAAARASTGGAVGGVQKSTRSTRNSGMVNVPTGPATGGAPGDSKIIVSSLPSDVTEGQIKDYFSKAVGPIKKCQITYGPNGVSRGIATIVFNKADAASRAALQHNGLLVDGKPLKIEVVVDASRAPPPPPVKGLKDRIAQPKSQARSAATTKYQSGQNPSSGGRGGGGRGNNGNGKGGSRRTGGTGGGRYAGRGKPKTTDELDADMVDYFVAAGSGGDSMNHATTTTSGGGHANGGNEDSAAANGGGALMANGGGDDMDEGIM